MCLSPPGKLLRSSSHVAIIDVATIGVGCVYPARQDARDSMSRMIVDIQLFFSSYAPLFVMLGLRFQSTPLRIICFMIGAGGALCLLLILWQIRRGAPKRYRIERVEDRGDIVDPCVKTPRG